MSRDTTVTIDYEDRIQVGRLIDAFWANGNDGGDDSLATQAALRGLSTANPSSDQAALTSLRKRIEALADYLERPLDGARQRANTGADFADIGREETLSRRHAHYLRALLDDGEATS